MELKILSIKEIVEDAELYPRHINDQKEWCDWQTVWKYSEAYKAGARFPPITVALFAGRHYLTDGKHRIEMYKKNKVDSVECQLWKASSRQEIFVEAIRANTTHGRVLSSQDRAEDIQKLRAMKFDDVKISEIMSIPISKLSSFVANRLTSSITGEEIILKGALKELVGRDVPSSIEQAQTIFASRSAEQIVEEFLRLLENNALNVANPKTLNKLRIIRKLLTEIILSRRNQ